MAITNSMADCTKCIHQIKKQQRTDLQESVCSRMVKNNKQGGQIEDMEEESMGEGGRRRKKMEMNGTGNKNKEKTQGLGNTQTCFY